MRRGQRSLIQTNYHNYSQGGSVAQGQQRFVEHQGSQGAIWSQGHKVCNKIVQSTKGCLETKDITSAPIGAWTCSFPLFKVITDAGRTTNQQTNPPTDQQTYRPGYRNVTLSISMVKGSFMSKGLGQ